MAAAGRRDVGQDLAAEPGHQLAERRGLRGHFMAVLDSTIVNVPARPGSRSSTSIRPEAEPGS